MTLVCLLVGMVTTLILDFEEAFNSICVKVIVVGKFCN